MLTVEGKMWKNQQWSSIDLFLAHSKSIKSFWPFPKIRDFLCCFSLFSLFFSAVLSLTRMLNLQINEHSAAAADILASADLQQIDRRPLQIT
jgi:hypothetical protein